MRGAIIRIKPGHAEGLRALWREMCRLGIEKDFGATFHEAVYNELINLQLRWGDAVADAKKVAGEE